MADNPQKCTLCGQRVEVDGFELCTQAGRQRFCCEGCLSIYQLLNPDTLLSIDQEEEEKQ